MNGDLREELLQNGETIKTELLRNPAIKQISIVSNLPGERFSVESLRPDGYPDGEKLPSMRFLRTDENFISTLDITIVEGRDFTDKSPNSSAFILNESAVRALKLKNPVGTMSSSMFGTKGEITGVVRDFNYASLHNIIEPLVIECIPINWEHRHLVTHHMMIKTNGGNLAEIIDFLEAKVDEIAPGSLFIYSLLDDNLNILYESEEKMNNIFIAFALFAILISCLGLYGLSIYSAETRTKEIGIRKVLGSSISGIVLLLTKDFAKWVCIAIIIGCPIAWFAMNLWLEHFAYRIDIGYGPVLIAGISALAISIITVSYQALKAAVANPVDSIKYE